MYSSESQWRFLDGFVGRMLVAASAAGLIAAALPVGASANPPVLCDFASGDGMGNPFLVANERDLNELRTCGPGLSYRQTADIVLTSPNWAPITNHNVADSFGGLYDGGGFSISNLVIDSTTGDLGLFYALEDSIVTALTLTGSVSTSGTVARVGVLAGTSERLTLQNVTVNATVNAPNADLVGGLVGVMVSSTVIDTQINGSVTGRSSVGGAAGSAPIIGVTNSHADVDVVGTSFVGGMFGTASTANFTNATASGDVTASSSVSGGFAGSLSGSAMTRVRASGDVNGQNWTGGLFGTIDGAAIGLSGATGDVSGDTYVGGFVADGIRSALSRVFATGDVTGSAFTGGFAGRLEGGPNQGDGLALSRAHAAGDVIFRQGAAVSGSLGGFAGAIGSGLAISRTYAAGQVDDSMPFWGGYVGGFVVGFAGIAVGDSLYDTSLNAQAMPATDLSTVAVEITGKTSAELREVATFVDDFDIEAGQGVVGPDQKIWGICPGVNDGLPFLNWAFEPGTCDQAAAAIAAALQAEADRLAAEQAARDRAAREAAEQAEREAQLEAERALALSLGLHVWVTAHGSTEAKFYARELVGGGKVQFYLNGVEIGWVRALDATEPKLRTLSAGPLAGNPYFVRTAQLELGRKNTLEIYVEGQRVHRVAYTR